VKKQIPRQKGFKLPAEWGMAKNCNVREESDFVIIEVRKELEPDQSAQNKPEGVDVLKHVRTLGMDKRSSQDGWMEAPVEGIKEAIKVLETSGKLITGTCLKENDVSHVGTYTVLFCGSKKNYWLESNINVSDIIKGGKAARNIRQISSTRRLDDLTEILTGTRQYRGNALGLTATPSTLFGIGTISYTQMENFPGLFLMDLLFEPETDEEAKEMSEKFIPKQDVLTVQLGRFLAYYSWLCAHHRTQYRDVDKQAFNMRQEALSIQDRIFNLQKTAGGDSKGRTDTKVDEMTREEEEKLLTTASITFSAVTKLEQTIGYNMYLTFGNSKSMEDIVEAVGPKKLEVAEMDTQPVSSLFDEFLRYADSVNVSYQRLRDDVNNTQSTLRNALDVLRTFIEHQQRKLSDRQSKMLFLLTMVFAAFGIADALSNLLAYYLSDLTMKGAIYTALAFSFSIVVSLLGFLIFYFAFIKKALEMK
jgi:hypothetical protein